MRPLMSAMGRKQTFAAKLNERPLTGKPGRPERFERALCSLYPYVRFRSKGIICAQLNEGLLWPLHHRESYSPLTPTCGHFGLLSSDGLIVAVNRPAAIRPADKDCGRPFSSPLTLKGRCYSRSSVTTECKWPIEERRCSCPSAW